jgi:hypothetical protein
MRRLGVIMLALLAAGCGDAVSGASPPSEGESAATMATTSTTGHPVPSGSVSTTTLPPATTTTEPPTTTTTEPATTTTGPGTRDDAPPGPELTIPAREPDLRSITEEEPLRVWVIGDSLAGPLGAALRQLDGQPISITVDNTGGSGLARPDLFDWPGLIEQRLPVVAPDAVIFHVGANDSQQIRTDTGWFPFGTAEWLDQYRTVVGSTMDLIVEHSTRVYWVGAPIMAGPGFSEDMALINSIFEEEAADRTAVIYVDAFSVFQDDEGRYAATLPGPDGAPVRVRDGDGVHYTAAGAALLAQHVWETVAAEWHLTAD